MSGPIVRSGPSKKFSEQWDSVFGDKKPKAKKSIVKATKKKVVSKKKKP
ncbi:MAG TPA: hypothetical protein P5307_08990 [Pirellulaceae bacterium]|nr:hypothetical protein [Planctomycetales bacterium]MCB9936813.1 hypothetical protein [Planctomycetaceae bacterium]HRX79183.1 hypothetical protein [Pirellulaceae bacterium]